MPREGSGEDAITSRIVRRAQRIRSRVLTMPGLAEDLEGRLTTIPKPFHGAGGIRLLIIGQDPTVQRKESRDDIKVVLNLD